MDGSRREMARERTVLHAQQRSAGAEDVLRNVVVRHEGRLDVDASPESGPLPRARQKLDLALVIPGLEGLGRREEPVLGRRNSGRGAGSKAWAIWWRLDRRLGAHCPQTAPTGVRADGT